MNEKPKRINWGKSPVETPVPTQQVPPAGPPRAVKRIDPPGRAEGKGEPLIGSYTDDFNILDVHAMIIRAYQNQKANKSGVFRQQLTQLELKFKGAPLSLVEHKHLTRQCDDLRQQIQQVEDDTDYQLYMTQTQPYITEYTKMGPLPKKVMFGRALPAGIPGPQAGEAEYRHHIIAQYLEQARPHYNRLFAQEGLTLDVVRRVNVEASCPQCGNELNALTDDKGVRECSKCGYEKKKLVSVTSYRDSDRVNATNHNNYEDRDNFYKAFLRFQGKQPNRIPDSLYSELDTYFSSYGLPTREQVRVLPLNPDGSRGQTTLAMLFKALSDRKQADFYDDARLIAHHYWGWRLPDCSHLEDVIMDDYDRTQKVFDEEPKTNRTSTLNTQYRLYQHLQARGYPCQARDFKMIKGESLEFHNDICAKMFALCDLNFVPV